MFKVNQNEEAKNKNEGFVDANGVSLDKPAAPAKEEKNPDDVDLNTPTELVDEHLKKIEEARLVFLKLTKKENIIKWIVALVSIGLLVFSMLYLLNKIRWLGITMMCVSVAFIIAYYVIVKFFNNKKMEEYLKVYYGNINAYVFAGYNDVKGDIAGRIANDEFNNALLYKDVSTIGSRNIVSYKINDINLKMCDCAAQKSTVKNLVPLFIGKFLIADNKYTNEEPIYIYLTGNSRALPPNNLDALPKVYNTKKMVIYTKNKNYERTLNANVRRLITSIVTNNILVDCAISIQKGKTYFALGYDDCLMVLPLAEKFNSIPLDRFKKDMEIVKEIVTQLN